MLKAMRTGSKSIFMKLFLFGLLIMAMAGLAVMDVQGMFRQGIKTTTIAKIDGNKISAVEFDRILRSEMQRQNIPQSEALRMGLPQQVLEREISNRVFFQAASDMSLFVDDVTVARDVKKMIRPLVDQGMTEQDALQRVLYTFGMSEPQLVATLKAQTAVDYLTHALASGVRAPRQLVDDIIKLRYEKRQGQYITLTAADAGDIAKPTDDELNAYYDTVADSFMLPEYRSFSVMTIDGQSLDIDTVVSKDDVLAYYDTHQEEYGTLEKRSISQIIVRDEQAAKDIYAEAEKSKDLRKAAADAKDKGARFIKKQEYTKADIVTDLADAVFEGTPLSVLAPVETPLGWHIIYVENVTPPVVTSFDDARASIEKKLAADKAIEVLYDRANEIDDLIAGGKTLTEIAQQFNLKKKTFEKITAAGLDAGGNEVKELPPAVLSAAFSLERGRAGQLIETTEGVFMVAEVSDIVPSARPDFEGVKDRIASMWRREQIATRLAEKSEGLIKRIEAGESFEKIADEAGKRLKKTDFVKRDSAKEAPEKNIIAALFSLEKGGDAIATVEGDNRTIVYLVNRRFDVPKDIKQEELDAVQARLDMSLQNEILEQYRQGLAAKYNVKINEDLLDEMYAPKEDEDIGQ